LNLQNLLKMNIEEIREYCLTKLHVTESMPFGDDTLVYKVAGKMFLLANLEGPLQLNLKASPEEVADRLQHFPEAIPAYHMNKIHWVSVKVEECNDIIRLKAWIDRSYELIVSGLPKKLRIELGF
jgi:predicted DNA-binding protein (MmcQ/YjbR family)